MEASTLALPATTRPTVPARISPRVVSSDGDAAVGGADAGDFAVFDDVDAEGVGGAGVAPGDGVVAGHAAAALQGSTEDGVAGFRVTC